MTRSVFLGTTIAKERAMFRIGDIMSGMTDLQNRNIPIQILRQQKQF